MSTYLQRTPPEPMRWRVAWSAWITALSVVVVAVMVVVGSMRSQTIDGIVFNKSIWRPVWYNPDGSKEVEPIYRITIRMPLGERKLICSNEQWRWTQNPDALFNDLRVGETYRFTVYDGFDVYPKIIRADAITLNTTSTLGTTSTLTVTPADVRAQTTTSALTARIKVLPMKRAPE